jgi:hypothetical protein
MKAYGGRCTDPHFVYLGTCWRWVVSFNALSLYRSVKKPPIPNWTGGWPVWTIWRIEMSWLYRDSNSDPSIVQLVHSRYTDYAAAFPGIYTWALLMIVYRLHWSMFYPSDARFASLMIESWFKSPFGGWTLWNPQASGLKNPREGHCSRHGAPILQTSNQKFRLCIFHWSWPSCQSESYLMCLCRSIGPQHALFISTTLSGCHFLNF